MKYLLRLLILLFIPSIIITCEEETFPLIHITQTESAFDPELAFGSVATERTFGISNWGSGTLSWTISENINWLTTDKTTGNSGKDTTIVTVTVNRDGLEPGVYTGNIELTGGIENISMKVTMVVAITGTFTDSRDNRAYRWVKIGDQVWMSENLAWLPKVSPSADGSFTEPFYYVHSYNRTNVSEAKTTDNYKTYGVLYNWPAALEACPEGWHLPSNDEWEQLAQYVNTQFGPYSREESSWTDGEGDHLSVSYGVLGKYLANFLDGTNDFGFSGSPGSFRSSQGDFGYLGSFGYWWSATESSNYDYKAWETGLAIPYKSLIPAFKMNCTNRDVGNSVRCIKD